MTVVPTCETEIGTGHTLLPVTLTSPRRCLSCGTTLIFDRKVAYCPNNRCPATLQKGNDIRCGNCGDWEVLRVSRETRCAPCGALVIEENVRLDTC